MSYKKSTHVVRETNTAAKLQHFFYSRKYFIKKIRFFVFFLLFALYVLHFLSRHLGSNDCFDRIFAAVVAFLRSFPAISCGSLVFYLNFRRMPFAAYPSSLLAIYPPTSPNGCSMDAERVLNGCLIQPEHPFITRIS